MADLLNWRRGIDTIGKSNDKVREQTGIQTSMEMRREETVRKQAQYRDSQIAQGLKSWGDAMDAKDKKVKDDELHRLDVQKKNFDLTTEEAMAPLRVKEKEAVIGQAESATAYNKKKLELEDKSVKDKDAVIAATEDAAVLSYSGPKPKEWASMSRQQKAAVVVDYEANRKDKTEEGYKQAQTAEVWQRTNKSKQDMALDAVKKMIDIDEKSGDGKGGNALLFSQNPDLIPLRNFDAKDEKQKIIYTDNKKAFEVVKNKTIGRAKAQNSVARIAKFGGLKAQDDGSYSAEQIKELWGAGGFKGYWKTITGDPKQAQLKMEMIDFLSIIAKDKTFGALNFEREVERAEKSSGGAPGTEKFNESFVDIISENGQAQAFFERQHNLLAEDRDNTLKDFQAKNGFNQMPTNDVLRSWYDLTPASQRENMSLDDYMAAGADDKSMKPGQYQANLTFGVSDDGKKTPNYEVNDYFSESVALGKAAKSGALLVASSKQEPRAIDFGSDKLNQQYLTIQKERLIGPEGYGSTGSLVGTRANQPQVTAGVGEVVDPIKCNPNTPMVYSPDSTTYKPVSSPCLTAAAGATPQGKTLEEYSKAVQIKSQLPDDWIKQTHGIFGMDKDANQGGMNSAVAAP